MENLRVTGLEVPKTGCNRVVSMGRGSWVCGGSALGLSSFLAVLTGEGFHEDRGYFPVYVVISLGKPGSQTLA